MDINVLVVFSSTRGETERLALTVGVGAIQARGNIRLRRLPPAPGAAAESMSEGERQAFERMARDYVAPRPADPPWADVLILAPSPRAIASLEGYVDELPSLGPVAGRIAGVVAPGNPQAASPIYAAAGRAGLIVVPAPSLASVDEQHAFGRQLVAFARALKTARA
jgi:hypothetical protein